MKLLASWSVPKGWACPGRDEGPTAGGALKPGAESRSEGPGSSPGSEVGAGARAAMGLWLFLGQRQGMAVVHTACGRSESKHLRSTPAGHEESCPVIALCWLGSPRQARRGPVSCDSGHSGLATQPRGIKYRDAPLSAPHPAASPSSKLAPQSHPCRALLCCGLSVFRVLSLGVGWKWGRPQATSSARKSGGGQGEDQRQGNFSREGSRGAQPRWCCPEDWTICADCGGRRQAQRPR